MTDVLAAEADLLGAMLATLEGLKVGLDACAPSDFLPGDHRALFAAVDGLYQHGQSVNVGSVHAASGVDRGVLLRLSARDFVAHHVHEYARIVAENAALRRAVDVLNDVSYAVREADLDRTLELLAHAGERISAPGVVAESALDAAVLAGMEFEHEWLVRDLLEFLEVVMLTAPEGFGKSELLRQFGICLASGLHPFTRVPVERRTVLLVDCENTQAQISRSLKRLLVCAGDSYQGGMFVEARPQGMDLTSRRDVRWLDALMARHDPDLFILGPLYKAYRGSEGRSKSSEEAAERVSATIDELKVKHHCAVLIEAHAGHGTGNDRDAWRPRGSSLWLGWPTFGLGLKPAGEASKREVDVVRWRGDRETGRLWPSRLCAGPVWPWEPLEVRAL